MKLRYRLVHKPIAKNVHPSGGKKKKKLFNCVSNLNQSPLIRPRVGLLFLLTGTHLVLTKHCEVTFTDVLQYMR